MQLYRESSCPYLGRFDFRDLFEMRLVNSSEALDDQALALWKPSNKESETMETDSAAAGNRSGDQTEVSRRNSSQMLIVMVETG